MGILGDQRRTIFGYPRMNMKSLKLAYFVVGMTGMFSMAVPTELEWLASLPVVQSCVLAVLLSLLLAALQAWLTQFRRRHIGFAWQLPAFAACGLLVTGMLVVAALDLLPPMAEDVLTAVLRLTLLALFTLIALHTQPASDHMEPAP